MRSFQFSISWIIVFIMLLAVYIAALASGTLLWSQIIYSLTVSLLFLAAIAAHKGSAFWYGCSVVGWGYFLLGVGPWFDQFSNSSTAMHSNSVNKLLLTNYLISEVASKCVPYLAPGDPQYVNRHQVRSFRVAYTTGIAHALLTVLFAMCGGMIAVLADQKRGDQRGTDENGTKSPQQST